MNNEKLNFTPDIENSFSYQGGTTLQDNWWFSFADPQLNHLISIGLTNNQVLVSELAKVQSRSTSLTIAQASLYPDLNLVAGTNSDLTDVGELNNMFIGVSSSWELDLWGRISSLEEKAQWNLLAQQALYKVRANSIAGSITTSWYGWQAEFEKKRMYQSQHQRTALALKVINKRFAMGKNSITDIWQQQRLLESISAQQAINDARLAIFQQQLALWLGVKTSLLPELIEQPLPALAQLPALGIPLNALQQRPDIQQAYAHLQSTNAALAVAVSEKFPRITLRANYQATGSNDIFSNWSGALISSLVMPLFDAGANQAAVEREEYLLKAALADYKQTWLEAVFSVEESLINEQQLKKVVDNLHIQLELAKKTERVIATKYLNGKSNYLNLLKAQETSLHLERQIVDAQRTLINNRIVLYRELSHGNFLNENNTPLTPLPAEQPFDPITIDIKAS